MLSQNHFYNETIKRTVAVFGTVFNNITIAKPDNVANTVSGVERVPIAYGPKSKFLLRIREQPDLSETKIAIKVPRMSFEITSLAYDTTSKLNKLNRHITWPRTDAYGNISNSTATQYHSTPYIIGFQLNIFGRNQDDVLQILEQIIPTFSPEYTVSVKDMEGPGLSADVPITLTGIGLADEYEGDLIARRVIIYSLEFTLKIRFIGPVLTSKMITLTQVTLHNLSSNTAEHDRPLSSTTLAGYSDHAVLVETFSPEAIPPNSLNITAAMADNRFNATVHIRDYDTFGFEGVSPVVIYKIFSGSTSTNPTVCNNNGAEVRYSYRSVSTGSGIAIFYSKTPYSNSATCALNTPIEITACLPSDAVIGALLNGSDPVSGTTPRITPTVQSADCSGGLPLLLTTLNNTIDDLIIGLQ